MTTREFTSIGEKLYCGTLQNGLTIRVLPKPGFAKNHAFFATDYGGADRRFRHKGAWTDTPAGVAHFLEHKMFDMPDGGNALAVLSANGASPNAFTSSCITSYYFEGIDGFEDNLKTLLEFVSTPFFSEESVAKEQGIIGQEIRMYEDDPSTAVYENLMRNLYAYNPIRDSVAGTVESIAQITPETLYSCHKVFYNPSNMVLCVVGDVDPLRVSGIAAEMLPPEPGECPERDYGENESLLPIEAFTSAAMEVAAPIFLIGAKIAPEVSGRPRLRQALLGELALECLVGKSSPFYARLYAKGLINDKFGSEVDYAAGTATILAEGESAEPERVLEEFRREVESVRQSGLSSDLFQRIKRSRFGKKLRALDDFAAQCYLLAQGQFAGYNHLDSFEMLEEINLESAEAYITECLAPERHSLSVVTPKR